MHKAPTNTGSQGKIGSIVRSFILHYKRLFLRLRPMTTICLDIMKIFNET